MLRSLSFTLKFKDIVRLGGLKLDQTKYKDNIEDEEIDIKY